VMLSCKCILHNVIRTRMFPFTKVSDEEALLLINDVLRQVRLLHKEVAIAVAGPEGELIAFLRMNGASPAASRIARNKAYTAAVDRKAHHRL
jgi:glc operon protein GlcG